MKHITDKTLNELANTGNKWAVVAVDETEYFVDVLKNKAKLIEAVYLVNLHEPTHLCELAVSYPALNLRHFVPDISGMDGQDDDDLHQIEYCSNDNEYRYFSGNSTFKVVHLYADGEEEDIIESEACNPSYC